MRYRSVQDDQVVTDLVARASDGDDTAWIELVDRYAALVWAICRQYRLSTPDADDVFQTVWFGLVEHLPKLREPAALPGWLATTTRRECLRILGNARRRQDQELDANADVPDIQLPQVDTRLLRAERDAALREAFAELEPRDQQLLTLLMQDPPVSYAEISRRLGMPIGAIGPTRARSLERLRKRPALAAWMADERARQSS